MKTLEHPTEVQDLLQALQARQVPVRVHPPRRAPLVGTVSSVTRTGFLTLDVVGAAPPRGVYLQVTGVHRGEAFGFVSEFLRTEATQDWLLTTPGRIEVRQRRENVRIPPGPDMSLRVAVSGRYIGADLFDISEGGVAFSTRDFPAPATSGMRLTGRLDLPRNRTLPVELEVVHVSGLRTGARFVKLPHIGRLELRNLVSRHERTGDLPEISLGT